MEEFIHHLPIVYVIYGNTESGKTTIVYEIRALLNNKDTIVITSSYEDYQHINNIVIIDEYDIEKIENFIGVEEKILILDDFLHICTEYGKIKKHLISKLTTPRKKCTNMNIIISTHSLTIGSHIRNLGRVFIILKIDKESKKIINQYLSLSNTDINKIKKILIKNKYSFLIFNVQGKYNILRIKI